MKRALILFFLFCVIHSKAQQKVFSEEQFIAVVKQFHPVAKLAANNIRVAKWNVTASRGGFDPQLKSESSRKIWDGVTYYDQTFHQVSIPTWYGIDLYAGKETINGGRVNPEDTKGSLTYIGFSLPIVQNMVMDKRRAALLLAKNYYNLSAVEQQVAVNDLLKDALESYWNWWQHFHVYELMQKALANAERRHQFIKSAYQLGDRPAIDTLEAFTQVQSFQIRVSEAFIDYTKARLSVSSFLWTEDLAQVDLSPDVHPAEVAEPAEILLDDMLNAADMHPELKQYGYKLNALSIEKRLNFQLLLPEVKFKYNQAGRDFSKAVNGAWFENNYNYGLSFSIPLRLSEGRGEYAKTKIKIENTRIEQSNKQTQIAVKVKQHFIEWQQTANQLSMQNHLVKNFSGLQRAEETRFANGESNLFLINTRELKTLEAEQKAIELKSKSQKTAIAVRWAAGVLAL